MDLAESLNKIDHKTCLTRPNIYKGENIEDRDQGKDLDVLSNIYDFAANDEFEE